MCRTVVVAVAVLTWIDTSLWEPGHHAALSPFDVVARTVALLSSVSVTRFTFFPVRPYISRYTSLGWDRVRKPPDKQLSNPTVTNGLGCVAAHRARARRTPRPRLSTCSPIAPAGTLRAGRRTATQPAIDPRYRSLPGQCIGHPANAEHALRPIGRPTPPDTPTDTQFPDGIPRLDQVHESRAQQALERVPAMLVAR